MPISQIKEHIDPRNLSVNVQTASGKNVRWGSDEYNPEVVPKGISITTRIPGGFATMDCQLLRRPDLTYYDLDRFAPVTCYGAGGSLVAFDGYLSSRPLDRGTQYAYSPEAIGWSGHMKDDSSFSMVYIDRELSKWVGPANSRILTNTSNGYSSSMFSSQVQPDQTNGNPSLIISAQGPLVKSLGEMWYDAGPNNRIGYVRTPSYKAIGYTGFPDGNNIAALLSCTDDNATTYSVLLNYGALSGSFNQSFSSAPYRYALIQHGYAIAAGSGITYGFDFENLSVLGNHGLALRQGISGTMADDGFGGDQVIADIILRACPLLNCSTGPGGSLVTPSFVMPHCVFDQPTTADAAVQAVNQYYLYDYGVYEDRTFFWRPPGTGTSWRLRLSEGVRMTSQGPQIETAFNGVIVQFTDPAGKTRTVGPPGYNGDGTSASLQDTSSTNPCNMYGRKRWAQVQIGTCTIAGAIQIGAIFLATTSARPSTGTASVVGFATDSNGREWPSWMIRAGDTVEFVDSSDTTPHYVLETSYDHDTLTNSLTLDAPPNSLDYLLQRMSLVLTPLG